MSILVTGVAGFIGSHCAKHLVQSGFSVVGIDNLTTGQREYARWGSFVQGDISDVKLIRQIIRAHRVTTVLHLAAFAHVGESINQPEKYFRNNVSGTHALLEAMVSEGVLQFVFASSCSVYGMVDAHRVSEDVPQHPLSPYGESKLSIERVLPWYESAHGLNWLALRYFNVAGAEVGLAEPESSLRIIPRSILAALGDGSALRLFGARHPTFDGTAVRDYVHVLDVMQANLLAIRYLQARKTSAVVNIGSGSGVSVRQIIDAVASATGRPVPVIESDSRPGDAACVVACSAKVKALLGWVPARSDIKQIVADAVASYTSRANARSISASVTSNSELLGSFSVQGGEAPG